jgi:hypothetical protein
VSDSLATPIAFIIFNRPDLTRRTFDRIRAARPRKLLVIADGPRSDRPGDADLCAQARAAVTQRVDWPCEVQTNFADVNLGCKHRVSSGLDWVFSQVERAIVLEDDILPDPSLFPFFEQMLDRFADDQRVMMVSGFNPLGQHLHDRQDYHFSYCGSIWGWASWRRAWRHYDVQMRLFDNPDVQQRVRDTFADPALYQGRLASYERCRRGEIDTWDFQWSFARIINSGLSVVPAVNLVLNLGFRPDATHTRNDAAGIGEVPVGSLSFPLRSPPCVAVDRQYDLAFTRALSPPRKSA